MSLIHPKISGAFVNRPLHERFLAAAITMALGPAKTEALVNEFFGRDIDFNEVVGGRPLHYYNGKNVPQLRREGVPDETIKAVKEAYTARGAEFPETDDTPMDTGPGSLPDFVPSPGDEPPPPPLRDDGTHDGPDGGRESADAALAAATEPPVIPGGSAPTDPNLIPVAGYRFGDLRGKSDDELRSLPNVGKATIAKVRALEAQYPLNPPLPGPDASTPPANATAAPPVPPPPASTATATPPAPPPAPSPADKGGEKK